MENVQLDHLSEHLKGDDIMGRKEFISGYIYGELDEWKEKIEGLDEIKESIELMMKEIFVEKKCPNCNGSGHVQDDTPDWIVCGSCNGKKITYTLKNDVNLLERLGGKGKDSDGWREDINHDIVVNRLWLHDEIIRAMLECSDSRIDGRCNNCLRDCKLRELRGKLSGNLQKG